MSDADSDVRLGPMNSIYRELVGKDIIVILNASQMNILGQTFRPIFTGRLTEVNNGDIQLNPVVIKMPNAPNYLFPVPLNFPINNISVFAPFERHARLTLT